MIFTTHKRFLLRHFLQDPVLFAYHIGDLDDFFFPDCLWPSLFSPKSGIDESLLLYTGGETPSLLAFGLGGRFEELLRAYLPVAPKQFFCHFQKQHRDPFLKYCIEKPLGTHLKMKLDRERFAKLDPPMSDDPPPSLRLDRTHEPALRQLYEAAYPDNYFVPRMLETGKYLGTIMDNQLVAVAGVHVVSDEHRIAVLGNVTSHPDYRGRHLATALTYQLTRELVAEDKLVCLNVQADNAPAIAVYRKLGFDPVHEYEEALFRLRTE